MLLSVCLKGVLEITFWIFFIYILHYFYIFRLLINEKRTPTELFIVAETRELSHLSSQLVQVVVQYILTSWKEIVFDNIRYLENRIQWKQYCFSCVQIRFCSSNPIHVSCIYLGRYICTKFRPFSTPISYFIPFKKVFKT